jgi:molecular chaperone DnaK (HSP70)
LIYPLLQEIASPIKRFLFENNLKVEELDNVEMIGGSSRIPKVQEMIGEVIGNQSKIGTHINADEAMVLGASFFGANSSKKFKVRGINLYDGFNFDIGAVLKNSDADIDDTD